jgi:hypothetical protein
VNHVPFCYFREQQNFDCKDGHYIVNFNPLLRAGRFEGELPPDTSLLQTIADGLRKNPEAAKKIMAKKRPGTYLSWHHGMEWDEFKQEFGI